MSIFAYIGRAKDQEQLQTKDELNEALVPKAQDQLPETLFEQSLEAAEPSMEKRKSCSDPRPDLEADTAFWAKLLIKAEKMDPMLAGTLHGLRCGGLRIKRGRTGYLLRPDFDPTGNLATWKDQNEYEHDKLMHLFQYRAEIKELMANL